MLTARQVSVHQTTRDQVLRYLNLNAIPQDSYSINPGNGQDYHVYTAFTYSFSVKHTENTVAGGSRTGNHFSRTGYTQYFSQCVQYANDAAKEKNAFLGKVINNAIQYFVDNATYVIWKSEKIFV